MRALGDYQAARELDEDTLARRRRVLGEDHPDTLNSATNLAAVLHIQFPPFVPEHLTNSLQHLAELAAPASRA